MASSKVGLDVPLLRRRCWTAVVVALVQSHMRKDLREDWVRPFGGRPRASSTFQTQCETRKADVTAT